MTGPGERRGLAQLGAGMWHVTSDWLVAQATALPWRSDMVEGPKTGMMVATVVALSIRDSGETSWMFQCFLLGGPGVLRPGQECPHRIGVQGSSQDLEVSPGSCRRAWDRGLPGAGVWAPL